MRVLSLFPRLDPAGGGLQSGGMNMTIASARAGVTHVVSCTERPDARMRADAMFATLESEGVESIVFPPVPGLPARIANEWGLSPRQATFIMRHGPEFDVIHIHGTWNGGALSGLACGRLRGVPTVVTPHESMTRFDIDDSRSAARRRQKLAVRAAYLRETRLFVVTSDLETGESMPPGTPHVTIPYPVYDDRIPAPALVARGTAETLTIGFLGRVHPKKNLPIVIAALEHLPAHVRVLIAGDGPAELVAAARATADDLGVADRVEWLGFVEPAERDAFLARIDVLAMPSTFESYGMSAAEAMLDGVPLVVSRRTGISEVVARQGGGLLIDPDARSLADAITELDEDRARLAQLGTAAQRAITTELGYESIGSRLRAAYEQAASEGRP